VARLAIIPAVKKLLLLELNEINFEFVEHYARDGQLPTFRRLIDAHGYAITQSEGVYEHVEPWIQWITVHTGKSYEEHRVFRLGDGSQPGYRQIWEELAQRGIKVGAFSPMNACNAIPDAAFFVPDPWTKTSVSAPRLMRAAYNAICQAVSDNASGRIAPGSALQLVCGLLAYSQVKNWPDYVSDGAAGLRSHWRRAVFLDRFLADCFIHLWRKTKPGFSTVFLNGAAHIQHHCLFNSAAYRGRHRNPEWYLPAGVDPVLDIYRQYDGFLADCLALDSDLRVMIATGLHQDPVDEPVFYWRLRDHLAFLRELRCEFEAVEPRMSRDFLVTCKDAAAAERTARTLESGRAADGLPLFEVDNRGETLFVTLSYPREIGKDFQARFNGTVIADFAAHTVFVAIKNGHHNGAGYFLDTGTRAAKPQESIPLTELWQRMVSAF
jgi:hypothetical protein